MPPAVAVQPDQLRDRLRSIRADLEAARSQRAVHLRERDDAREKVAQLNVADDRLTETSEFKAAEQAVERLRQTDERIEHLQAAERGVLAMFGEADAGVPTPSVSAGAESETVKALTRTPGMFLASALERRKREVVHLPSDVRLAAMTTPLTTGEVSTVEEADAVIDLLSPASVAMRSGINTLAIDTTKVRVPRFTDLPEAGWVAELSPFPVSGPGVEMVESEPPKVGLVTELSLETFADLRPTTLAMLQTQLLRAVALAYDNGILFGSGTGAEPTGVANTTGIAVVADVPLTGLAAFAEAIGDLVAVNAFPGAIAMNPLDVGTLLAATEFTGGTTSNVPLWKDAIKRAADGAYALTLPYFGIPVWPTPAAPQGTALVYDPSTIIAVIRREADVAVDPYYSFQERGTIGLRVYLRADVIVGQPAGAVKITVAAPAP
jgi:HK97 family phage major capsid protein